MQNILIISASPRGESGNSASIARYAYEKLNEENAPTTIHFLKNELKSPEKLMWIIEAADVLLLSVPVYQNTIPGIVSALFEDIRKKSLTNKRRKLLIIANSGFAAPDAGACAIETCRLFAAEMGWEWMGGFTAAPGTLIDGKKLETKKSTYHNLIRLLDVIQDCILSGKPIPENAANLLNKPLFNPFLYRIGGRMQQKKTIKEVGKDKYFAKPLNPRPFD